MLMDAVDGRRGEPVADPYYGDTAAFEEAWRVISLGTGAWVDRFIREGVQQRA